MRISKWIGIAALLLIIIATAACVQAPATQGPASGNPEIHYKLYGGFVRPEYSVQKLVVVQDRATFTISGVDGNITQRFEKALTREQFNAIVTVFSANNFSSYGDRYEEGQTHISDVGFADISFTADNRTKTVTTYNVNRYMPDGLIRIREKLQETIAFTKMPDERSSGCLQRTGDGMHQRTSMTGRISCLSGSLLQTQT
jgi:hypothetical protein